MMAFFEFPWNRTIYENNILANMDLEVAKTMKANIEAMRCTKANVEIILEMMEGMKLVNDASLEMIQANFDILHQNLMNLFDC